MRVEEGVQLTTKLLESGALLALILFRRSLLHALVLGAQLFRLRSADGDAQLQKIVDAHAIAVLLLLGNRAAGNRAAAGSRAACRR